MQLEQQKCLTDIDSRGGSKNYKKRGPLHFSSTKWTCTSIRPK